MADEKIVRVALLGAESTGKSTLAAALAEHYGTVWVPEYLREFVETQGRTPQEHEQFPIATTQILREKEALRKAKSYLFCDTTPLITVIYSRFYFGREDEQLAQLAQTHTYDATIVTAPTGPWIPDGIIRESDEVRQLIHRHIIEELEVRGIGYALVDGETQERVRQVAEYLASSGRNMRG